MKSLQNSGRIKTYLINLDSATDRLERMKTRLSALNLDFERVSAVVAKELQLPIPEFDEKKFKLFVGKKTNKNEIGCFLSHIKTYETFLKSDAEFALVLEDDMVFQEDFPSIVTHIINSNAKWDFVKFNTAKPRRKLDISVHDFSIGNNKYAMTANLFPRTKSGAYLINRKAAKSILSNAMPMTVTFDHEMIKFWKHDIRQYSLFPSPTMEDGSPSIIAAYGSQRNRFPWYKRIPVFFYRYFYAQLFRFLFFYKLLKK